MIKHKGYRVELAEIENNVLNHSGVEEVACVYVDKAIVLFVVPHASSLNLLESKLRSKLAETLPNYMRPEKMFISEKLPKSVRGKVDRGRLKTLYLDWLKHPAPNQYCEQENTEEVAL